MCNYGEEFTAEREVEAMCDLVKQETERIDSRFLEPACGDGNLWCGDPSGQCFCLPGTVVCHLVQGYKSVCKKECSEETQQSARFILERNIAYGNALTLRCVDENGQDTEEEVAFSKWTFPFNDAWMQRNYQHFLRCVARLF